MVHGCRGEMPEVRAVKGQDDNAAFPLKLRSLVWRSSLLNLAVVLTALPVLAFAGGPEPGVPALAVVSVLIWIATFTAFSLVSMTRMFWCPGVRGGRQ
jgi:polyferredoxin